jgi:spoIIIJ-associated protein
MSEKSEQIKKIIEELLEKMDFLGEINLAEQDDGSLSVDIQSPEAAFLIGRDGENLAALQQISRALVNKKMKEPTHFALDVNNYHSGKIETIKAITRQAVKKVQQTGYIQWLPIMNSYERRIAHMVVAENEGVKSESEGVGETRRIKIEPVK